MEIIERNKLSSAVHYPTVPRIFCHFAVFIYDCCSFAECVENEVLRTFSRFFSLNSRGTNSTRILSVKNEEQVLIWQFNYWDRILRPEILKQIMISVFTAKKLTLAINAILATFC